LGASAFFSSSPHAASVSDRDSAAANPARRTRIVFVIAVFAPFACPPLSGVGLFVLDYMTPNSRI
jgi:hypothetical protein